MALAAPGTVREPAGLADADLSWEAALVPGTVAGALRELGRWSFEEKRDFDAEEWWYRRQFAGSESDGQRAVLMLDGLATFATVWLNGEKILESESMYAAHEVEISALVRDENELVIRFASLTSTLDARPRQPRARWKTSLVAEQRLRGVRTSLLGRMPGWSPPVAPVGPWRPVYIEYRRGPGLAGASVRAVLDAADGVVVASIQLSSVVGGVRSAVLRVGGHEAPMTVSAAAAGNVSMSGSLRIADVAKWWPHTHGGQPLFEVSVTVVDERSLRCEFDFGRIGFRSIRQPNEVEDSFGLEVNGVPVFCRGACWTPLDVAGLVSSGDDYRTALTMAREAGMNMIRVGGTMVYESPDFFDVCDELGILVWQDAMFANMDYSSGDSAFMASVDDEMRHVLSGLEGRPSLAVVCGGSEVAQQASMLGLTRGRWQSELFESVIPALVNELCGEVPCIPSSPWGGALPFQPSNGVTHYYGVGAYLRPFSDARTSEVKFASECLAFANVPSDDTISRVPDGAGGVGWNEGWKRRVPRDSGSPWDFEDVRDHYLRVVFGVDPTELRSADRSRYLALSRVVTGEVMERVIGEWRRPSSTCNGALVWLYRDLWPGAGWGVTDSFGNPKAAWYYLRRAMQPITLIASDEGLNGLWLHVVNETPGSISCKLDVKMLRSNGIVVASGERDVALAARSTASIHADEVLGGFLDITYAYRFGPPNHELTVATLRDAVTGDLLEETFHFPEGPGVFAVSDIGLEAVAVPTGDGAFRMRVTSRGFAQSVEVDVPEFVVSDSFFHLAPGGERIVHASPRVEGQPLQGKVAALNAPPVSILVSQGV